MKLLVCYYHILNEIVYQVPTFKVYNDGWNGIVILSCHIFLVYYITLRLCLVFLKLSAVKENVLWKLKLCSHIERLAIYT